MSIRLSGAEQDSITLAMSGRIGCPSVAIPEAVEQILTTRLEALAARLTAAETRAAWTKPSGGTED